MSKNEKITFELSFKNYLSEEWIFLLKNYTSIHQYTKMERIFSEGELVTGVYFINAGKVKVSSGYSLEYERILRLSGHGEILGHRAISSSHYSISAVALTDAEITFIPVEIFQKLIKNNAEFAMFIINLLARDLKDTEERMKSIIHHDVIVRIAMIIAMLIDAFGYDDENAKKLHYTLPRCDMASFAGTTYESVIRNLAKLEDMNIIQLDNKAIHILNEQKLRKIISVF